MASVSQGATVSWGGASFSEVTSISVSGCQAAVVDVTGRLSGRVKVYESADSDFGSLTVQGYVGNVSTADVGRKNGITVSGGGVSWSSDAILEGLEFVCQVGDVTRFNYKFKLSGIDG